MRRSGRPASALVIGAAAVMMLIAGPALAEGSSASPTASPSGQSPSPAATSPSAESPSSSPAAPSSAPSSADEVPRPSDGGSPSATPDDRGNTDRTLRRKQAAGVAVVDDAFDPGSITIDVGTQVTWTSSGQNPHTVTADDGSFGSGNLQDGDMFSSSFPTPGSYAYYCEIHGGPGGVGMSGVVVVRGADPGDGDGGSGGGPGAAGGAGDLPATGGNVTVAVVAMLGLVAAGIVSVRAGRRARPSGA